MTDSTIPVVKRHTIRLETGVGTIEGELVLPEVAAGIVLFAHGSGSSRLSPRNQFVAETLQNRAIGTMLLDLCTEEEVQVDACSEEHRFDVDRLASRLLLATDWLASRHETQHLPVGYFGASTGAAAALAAAAQRRSIMAVVSRGGRPDLAGDSLWLVRAPTLLIVGDLDYPVLRLNRIACEQLTQAREKELHLVPEATHLFEEPGALDEVARLAGDWFVRHLQDAALESPPSLPR